MRAIVKAYKAGEVPAEEFRADPSKSDGDQSGSKGKDMTPSVHGIHHVTCIAGMPGEFGFLCCVVGNASCKEKCK